MVNETFIPSWLNSQLTIEDCKDITNKIAEIERHTSGEVVPIVVRSSSTVGHIPYIIFPSLVLIDFISGIWDWTLLTAQMPYPLVILIHLLFIISICIFSSRMFWLQRMLTTQSDQAFQVEQRAIVEFYENKVHKTKDKTGILILISIMEKMAVVIGDEQINSRLHLKDWKNTLDLIIKELKKGKLKQGLLNGLESSKQLLATHFPIAKGDINELSNQLIIKD